ncbi:unnamed protein product, partial [Mesorhabditis belari]|uniref:Uncharacterized protein n=1 Tax=Mesorhabditis belari TaxID=2138241 RepID=A0AAF3ELU7_9BILA
MTKYKLLSNGTCIYPPDQYLDRNFYYDCILYYNEYGVSIVNSRTLHGYKPSIYMLIMALASAIIFVISLMSVYLVKKNRALMIPSKIFLFAGAFLSIFKGFQMFFQLLCSMTFNKKASRPTFTRFFCLNTDGYPVCGFFLNQMISAYALAAVTSYRLLHWVFSMNRFLSVYFDGQFYLHIGSVVSMQAVFALTLAALPFVMLTGNAFIYNGVGKTRTHVITGFYYHPISFAVREHWQLDEVKWAFKVAPLMNRCSAVVDLVFFVVQALTYLKIQKLKITNAITRRANLKLQYQILIIHFVLLFAWIVDSFYSTFFYKATYQHAKMSLFILENAPGWIIGILAPLMVCIFNEPMKRLSRAISKPRPKQRLLTVTQTTQASSTTFSSRKTK